MGAISSLARARRHVALSGAVVGLVAALALWQVGGPAASRQQARDARRLDDLQAIAGALDCHARGGHAPGRPAALAEISPACLAPDRAAGLADPATGQPYPLAYPEPGVARICAGFEAPAPERARTPPNFDAAAGCITLGLPARTRG